MKAKEAMRLLRISRQTLASYVKAGKVEITVLPNGRYEYCDESIFSILNQSKERKTYLYARVSSEEQAQALEMQIVALKKFCTKNHYPVSDIFSEITNGVQIAKDSVLFQIIQDILSYHVSRLIIASPDRLSRTEYSFLKQLFSTYACELIVMSEYSSKEQDQKELFSDISCLLNNYDIPRFQVKNVLNSTSGDMSKDKSK